VPMSPGPREARPRGGAGGSALAPLERHEREIEENLGHWERKPVLREVFRGLHLCIAAFVEPGIPGDLVELGSGIGNIKEVLPGCLRTDLFPRPWLDRTENAYRLSFEDRSVSHVLMFDVFHHLRYPGTALDEVARVLVPGGRLLVFEPFVSLLGLVVYGVFHKEPTGLLRPITWRSPAGWEPGSEDYYAAQGNATRALTMKRNRRWLDGWRVLATRRLPAVSYLASGGYSGPQLLPDRWVLSLGRLDRLLAPFPWLFATRLLVVLEKPAGALRA
jgi:SAM-dependent methyltransferase